jgi:hypothetical protein
MFVNRYKILTGLPLDSSGWKGKEDGIKLYTYKKVRRETGAEIEQWNAVTKKGNFYQR